MDELKKLKIMGLALGMGALLAACSGSDEGAKDSENAATKTNQKKLIWPMLSGIQKLLQPM